MQHQFPNGSGGHGSFSAAMPAQPPEMCDLSSKPVETPGRKVTGLRGVLPTLAGPPVKRISPFSKPVETRGRKAMGANAAEQSQPGCRRNVNCFANQGKSWGAKLWGLTRQSRPRHLFAGRN